MSENKLDNIFDPDSVAVVGASEKDGSVGLTLMENLTGNEREIYPVNPNRDEVLGLEAYSDITKVPETVDLAVIATPAPTVPGITEQCAEEGIPAAIIISAGFSEAGEEGEELEEELGEVNEEYDMRILGPNCLGVINPQADLNASIADDTPEEGEISFISQSGALASGTLDWAIEAQFGFSNFVSVGNMVDITFSDLIDYFGRDKYTESILMYIESIKEPKGFMSAARSFARTKPIMAVKSGKYKEGAEAVASHTGSLAGSDDVYDAAFKRAGVTRVESIKDLFSCSEILAKQDTPKGPNLAIVTNAGGPGAMATDALIENGGNLAELSDETLQSLDKELPDRASLENPVDLTGDGGTESYRKATEICMEDDNVDGVLCIYAPLGTLEPEESAEAIVDLGEKYDKPLLTCWMGGKKVRKGQNILRDSGFSVQSTPEQSVKSYMYLYRYARNLERLLETPKKLPGDRSPPKYHLKAMIRKIAKSGREVLTEAETKKILETYGIPAPQIHVASSPEKAAEHASHIGFPVAMKVVSHDITHKASVGGVKLRLHSEEEVKEAYEEIVENVKDSKPSAEIEGISIQKMIEPGENNVELIMGAKKDPLFGSTVVFGKGGRSVEEYNDISVGLPPLNQTLAKYLMEETKVYDVLKGSDSFSENMLRSLERYLVDLSQILIDFPEIEELDINPLVPEGDSFTALDGRVVIDKEEALKEEDDSEEHLAIKPYPRKYEEQWQMEDGREITLRPIRPEDEPLEFDLFDTFSKETWRHRFFGPMKDVSHKDMVRYTNIDYRREMAIIGVLNEDGEDKMIGVGRLKIDPDKNSGEFAVVVGDPWQGLGLGEKLMDCMIGVAEDKDLESIYGIIKGNNSKMISLCEKLDFDIKEGEGKNTVKASFDLS